MEEIKDGIINIYKPKNCTSHDVVSMIKKATGKKVGHTGTLDPLAQGVLPILIGKATLCAKYLNNYDKTYRAQLLLGKNTTTLDEEGEIVEETEIPKNLLEDTENIKKVLQSFIGKIIQTPPIYSSIKIKGKKLYEYARKGQTVEIPSREVTIYDINLKNIDINMKTVEFEVSCSKGTYIRTLCKDIAARLGTIGYMKNLVRTKVGDFEAKNAITVTDGLKCEEIAKNIIPIEKIFKDKPLINLEQEKMQYFLNGVQLTNKKPEGIYRIYVENKFLGIGIIKNNLLKRDIIL